MPTVYHDVYDSLCNLVPNTTPSTAEKPYNLHDGPVVTTAINKASPYTDLEDIINGFHTDIRNGHDHDRRGGSDDDRDRGRDRVRIDRAAVLRAIDILEGNPIPNRVYSGFPILHYKGPVKRQDVDPVTKNVNIHLIYYRSHIEGDTALINTMPVMDDTWTVTYTVDMLDKGADDFSPSTMYFDDPNAFGGLASGVNSMKPLIMEDLTFFPQNEGTRNVYKIKMAPGRYFNGTYTWGWRVHPGRVQFMENENKAALWQKLATVGAGRIWRKSDRKPRGAAGCNWQDWQPCARKADVECI